MAFLNLKEEKDLNTLTEKSVETIWIPNVLFHNTEDKRESVIDGKAFTTIRRSGSPEFQDITLLHNAHIYPGGSNPITSSRVYSQKFLCDFDMSVYPFDTQNCSVILVMKGNSGNFVRLVPSGVSYLGPTDLTMYFVKNVTMDDVLIHPGGVEAVAVKLIFGRRILTRILTTYLPTFLICLVSFSTNHFKSTYFEAIVTVNLTSLLVLTTLFISVSQSLPQTAYIKLMDVWLIFCLLVPFSEVLLQVAPV